VERGEPKEGPEKRSPSLSLCSLGSSYKAIMARKTGATLSAVYYKRKKRTKKREKK